MRVTRYIALTAALVVLSVRAQAEDRNSAEVSYLDGDATAAADSGSHALALHGLVYENETVQTGANTKLELRMKDGSVVRLGPTSKLLLKSAYFGAAGEKKFSAKLMFGKVWSKVSGLVGGDSKFEVETDNAVAGVRGTTFRVDARTDRSVLVRVYAGAVAMAGKSAPRQEHNSMPDEVGPDGKVRHRKAAPTQVSKGEWEQIVGKMMELTVSADGTPGKPTAFTAQADSNDEWAAWNQVLDQK